MQKAFPDFHPAFVPPPSVAKQMELSRHGADGLAPCNVEVASWDQLPALEVTDGAAECCYGTCLRCRREMDKLAEELGRPNVIARRGEENTWIRCFAFRTMS